MLRNVSSRAATAGRTRASQRLSRMAQQQQQQASSGHSQSQQPFRSFATTDKKRALNAQQLKGSSGKPESTNKIPPPEPASKDVAADESFSVGPVLALLGVAGGGYAAYSKGFLDDYLGDGKKPVVKKEAAPVKLSTSMMKEEAKPTAPAATPKTAASKTKPAAAAASTKAADESLAKVAKEEVALSKKEVEEFNEIIADVIGEATMEVEGVKEAVAAIAEEEKKAAAAAEKAAKKAAKAAKKAAKKSKKAEPVVVVEEPVVVGTAAIATSALDESKIMAEIQALKKQLNQRGDAALAEAHTELAKVGGMDIMGMDLDTMTPSQLKVRLVQMARDLEERTKWEAVRLQEFLSMKEKEVEDRCVIRTE